MSIHQHEEFLKKFLESNLVLFERKVGEKFMLVGHSFYSVGDKYALSSEIAIEGDRTASMTKKNFQLLTSAEVVTVLKGLITPTNQLSTLSSFPSGYCVTDEGLETQYIRALHEFKVVTAAISTQLGPINKTALDLVGISRWSGVIVLYSEEQSVEFMLLFDDKDKIIAWRESKNVVGESQTEGSKFNTDLSEFTSKLSTVLADIDKSTNTAMYKYAHCRNFSVINTKSETSKRKKNKSRSKSKKHKSPSKSRNTGVEM